MTVLKIVLIAIGLPAVCVFLAFLLSHFVFWNRSNHKRTISIQTSAKSERNWQMIHEKISVIPISAEHSFLGDSGCFPPPSVIEQYRCCGLDTVFGEDGILYYTENEDVIRMRNELFSELREDFVLREAFLNFQKSAEIILQYTASTALSRAETMKKLCTAKQYLGMFADFAEAVSYENCTSRGTKKFYEIVCNEIKHPDFVKLREILQKIPTDYWDIRSITVTVNLDAGFYPTSIGLVSVGKNISAITEIQSEDSAFLHAILSSADKWIEKQLEALLAEVEKLLKRRISEKKRFFEEVLFAMKVADVMTALERYGSFDFSDQTEQTGKNLCSTVKAYEKIKMGYPPDVISGTENSEDVYYEADLMHHMGIGVMVKK